MKGLFLGLYERTPRASYGYQLDIGKCSTSRDTDISLVIDIEIRSTFAALHVILLVCSLGVGLTACPLASEHAATWVSSCMTFLTSVTVFYCMGYVWYHNHSKYSPSVMAWIVLVVSWQLMILPWAWLVYVLFEIRCVPHS